jgi:hypothetical protein
MLEIIGIILLCNKNAANALKRGRKPTVFVCLTVGLWLGMEALGALIGFTSGLEAGAYALALLFAAMGGFASYLIAKNAKPGNYVPQARAMAQQIADNAQALDSPAQITIMRERSMVGALVTWSFTLNGRPTGRLGNGKSLTASTAQRQNILRATDAYGTEIAPFVFDVESGGAAEIHFKANKFLPARSRGIFPATVPPSGSAPASEQASFCHTCGKPFEQAASFCEKCGTRRFVAQPASPQPASPRPGASSDYAPAASAVFSGQEAALPLAPNHARAGWTVLWLFLGWSVVFALHCIRGLRMLYSAEAGYLIADVLLGVAVYLLLQRELKYKLYATSIAILQVLLSVWSQGAYQMNTQTAIHLFRLRDLFAPILYARYFFGELFATAVIMGAAALFGWLLRGKPEKRRATQAGLYTAGIALIFLPLSLIIRTRGQLGMMPPLHLFSILLGNAVGALAIFLAVLVLYHLHRLQSGRIRLQGWAKAWCWICTIGMGAAAVVLLAIAAGAAVVVTYTIQLVFSLFALAGFILLLRGRRAGFYFILFGAFIALTGQFQSALQMLLYRAPMFIAPFIGSILGVLNPVITWLSIRGSWHKDAAPTAAGQTTAPAAQPATSVQATTPTPQPATPPQPAGKPEAAAQPAAPETKSAQNSPAAPGPVMVVFATESDRAAAMAIFGNAASYFSAEHCIEKVRQTFRLAPDFPIRYVERGEWGGPMAEQNGNGFTLDMDFVKMKQLRYLVGPMDRTPEEALSAIESAQAMQLPNLGLLWLCVRIGG